MTNTEELAQMGEFMLSACRMDPRNEKTICDMIAKLREIGNITKMYLEASETSDTLRAELEQVVAANKHYDLIQKDLRAENERLRAAGNHHPDCNYWKWDWRYSWAPSDCTCETVGAAPWPGCMAPDGAEPCPQYQQLRAALEKIAAAITYSTPHGAMDKLQDIARIALGGE